MAQKDKRDENWVEAKRRCRLNQDDIRMAKELGMNPRSLIKNIPSKSQQWKAPVKYWIRDLYEKKQMKMARRRASKSGKSSPATPATSRLSEAIPPDVNFQFDHGPIPADPDFPFDDYSIPVDLDFLGDDDSIPADVGFFAEDDSIPF